MSPEVGPKNWAVVKNGVRAKPSKRKEKLEEDANSIWKDQPDSPKVVYLLGFVHSTQKFHKNCKFENNCPPFLNLVSKTSRRIPPKKTMLILFFLIQAGGIGLFSAK